MKTFKTTLIYKSLCAFLVCLCFAVSVTIGTAGFLEFFCLDTNMGSSYIRQHYGDDYLASTEGDGYLQAVSTQYYYALKEKAGEKLNPSEQYQRDKANERLRTENTNFRYRILDLDGNPIMSNLSGAEDITKIATKRYYSALSDEAVFYSQGYLSAYSLEKGTEQDYLNRWFVYDEKKNVYYSIDETNDYDYELENYESAKQEWEYQQKNTTTASFSADEVGPLTRKRMDLDGYFDPEDDGETFWHYSVDKGTFLAVEYRWEGDEEGTLIFNNDADNDWQMAMSYMDEDGDVYYYIDGTGYAKSAEHYDPNSETVYSYQIVTPSEGDNATSSAPSEEEPEPGVEAVPAPPVDNRHTLSAIVEWGVADVVWQGKGVSDEFQNLYHEVSDFQRHLPYYITLTVASGVLCLVFLVMLLCAIGHTSKTDEITLAPLHRAPADVLLCVIVTAVAVVIALGVETLNYYYSWLVDGGSRGDLFTIFQPFNAKTTTLLTIVGGTAFLAMLVALPFLTTVTGQLKTRSFVRRLLLTWCCRIAVKALRWAWGLMTVFVETFGSAYWFVIVGYLSFHMVLGVLTMQGNYDEFCIVLACLMIMAGLAGICFWLNGWKKAQKAAKCLAEGDLTHQTDTEKTYFGMKRHIENLNSISEGMNRAVQEQMKSERFRTELITNVSHDLKTPLTSIISYVDLLKKREIEDETARGYIAVLDQKSQRLKTLTEDLVEASKAATGVLSVNKERLEVGQLIHQAVGEYEERLQKAGLIPVTTIPEGPVYVSADGRHLWRIMDNLLGNCAKYAMAGTRVYVTVEETGGKAVISVKNVSAEPLNVPAEELMERFVRGDSSRTNEGSGLGLSIAQSLARLQGAEFGVSTDGDLFKAEIVMNED